MLIMRLQENDKATAQLHMNSHSVQRLSMLNPSVIDITSLFAPERAKVEAFIQRIYQDSYNAHIHVSYPTLMSVRNEQGEILAAAGFRLAHQERLFLEQYTGQPIETILTDKYAEPIARQEIVEIGNLASAGGGASLFLFAALSSYLGSRHVRYAAITGTDMLRTRLRKLGLSPQIICDADATLLPKTEKDHWGTYYNTQPRVLAGSICQSVSHLKNALGVVYEDYQPLLLPRLHYTVPA